MYFVVIPLVFPLLLVILSCSTLKHLSDVLAYIEKGNRMDCPQNCPPEVYEIMKTCWYERPEDRPTFKELLEQLKALPPSAVQTGFQRQSRARSGPTHGYAEII